MDLAAERGAEGKASYSSDQAHHRAAEKGVKSPFSTGLKTELRRKSSVGANSLMGKVLQNIQALAPLPGEPGWKSPEKETGSEASSPKAKDRSPKAKDRKDLSPRSRRKKSFTSFMKSEWSCFMYSIICRGKRYTCICAGRCR